MDSIRLVCFGVACGKIFMISFNKCDTFRDIVISMKWMLMIEIYSMKWGWEQRKTKVNMHKNVWHIRYIYIFFFFVPLTVVIVGLYRSMKWNFSKPNSSMFSVCVCVSFCMWVCACSDHYAIFVILNGWQKIFKKKKNKNCK